MAPTTPLTRSPRTDLDALRRAAILGTRAPSVHNTQPWRFVVRPHELHVLADRTRRLQVLDPSMRQLTISLGAALFNARVSIAADGLGCVVERFPDRSRPELAAVLRLDPTVPVEQAIAPFEHVIEVRATNRRRFADDPVPPELVEALEVAAAAEGGWLHPITDADQRLSIATLSQHADNIEVLDPAYRAELRAWTTDDPGRRDGVRSLAVPHVDGPSFDEVPIRDFDTRGTGYLPTETHSTMAQCLVLISTTGDGRTDWLRAGEALEHVLLEVARHGFAASPLTQVTEVPSARAQLRRELRMREWPHVLLRIGRAPLTPVSGRRRLMDVLVEDQ